MNEPELELEVPTTPDIRGTQWGTLDSTDGQQGLILNRPNTFIGRHESNHFVMDHPNISPFTLNWRPETDRALGKSHCIIRYQAHGVVVVEDLSRMGTFVGVSVRIVME